MERLIAGAKKIGLHLTERQIEQFCIYYRELIDWNQRINLTTITDYEEAQVKHFLDSLTVTLALEQSPTGIHLRLIDVGTGAGLPGIPLKIVSPDIELVLLEATAKKTDFLRYLISRLGLDNVAIIAGRAEDVAHDARYREKFDLVLSRAVAPLPVLVELTLPFCTIGGSVITQKKGTIDREISNAGRAISLMGGKLWEVKRVALEEFIDERWLVLIRKVSPTPQQFPRRPGIPAKRPFLDKQPNQL